MLLLTKSEKGRADGILGVTGTNFIFRTRDNLRIWADFVVVGLHSPLTKVYTLQEYLMKKSIKILI